MLRGVFLNRIPYRRGCVARLRSLGLLFMLAASAATGESGSRTGLDPRPQYDDLAALKSRESRAELSCQITPDKPNLGFDCCSLFAPGSSRRAGGKSIAAADRHAKG